MAENEDDPESIETYLQPDTSMIAKSMRKRSKISVRNEDALIEINVTIKTSRFESMSSVWATEKKESNQINLKWIWQAMNQKKAYDALFD